MVCFCYQIDSVPTLSFYTFFFPSLGMWAKQGAVALSWLLCIAFFFHPCTYILFTFAPTSFLILLNFWYGTCIFFLSFFFNLKLFCFGKKLRGSIFIIDFYKFSEKNKKALSNASALSAIWRAYASFKGFIIVCVWGSQGDQRVLSSSCSKQRNQKTPVAIQRRGTSVSAKP